MQLQAVAVTSTRWRSHGNVGGLGGGDSAAAGRGGGQPLPAKGQDFPAGGWLEDEGGDAEDLSPSLWSVSSAEADARELLRDKHTC